MALKSELADAVVGARLTPQTITWTDDAGTAKDLTGATVTARIEPKAGGAGRDADGVFTLVGGGSTGQFTWQYSEADVATAGGFNVQFKAAFAGGAYDLTRKAEWRVREAI
jgi:hypothetical protein